MAQEVGLKEAKQKLGLLAQLARDEGLVTYLTSHRIPLRGSSRLKKQLVSR
jgi:hypothetical protein